MKHQLQTFFHRYGLRVDAAQLVANLDCRVYRVRSCARPGPVRDWALRVYSADSQDTTAILDELISLKGVDPDHALRCPRAASHVPQHAGVTVIAHCLPRTERGRLDRLDARGESPLGSGLPVSQPQRHRCNGMTVDARDAFAKALLLLLAMSAAGCVHVLWLKSAAAGRLAQPLDGGLTVRGQRLSGPNKMLRDLLVMLAPTEN